MTFTEMEATTLNHHYKPMCMTQEKRIEILTEVKHLCNGDSEKIDPPYLWYHPVSNAIEEYQKILINKSKYILRLKGELIGSKDAFQQNEAQRKKIARIRLLEGELAILHSMKLLVQQFSDTALSNSVQAGEVKYWTQTAHNYYRHSQDQKELYEFASQGELFMTDLALDLAKQNLALKTQLNNTTHEK